MLKELCDFQKLGRQHRTGRGLWAGVLPTPNKKMSAKVPEPRVDIREPRYAMAALETLYRKCNQKPLNVKVEEADLWHFAKFPDIWATNAIRCRTSGWNYKRAEPVVLRVRQLYVWATPILEG